MAYETVRNVFVEELPQGPATIDSLLSRIETEVVTHVALHYSPHFYAWVTSNASQASILGDMIANALNVNATTWMNAASASELEQLVIQWIGQFIDYSEETHGVLLSGGSMANLTGLRAAITQKAPYDFAKQGLDREKPLVFYVSKQRHFCIDRAISTLGIGSENLRLIETDGDFKIDTVALRAQIEVDLKEGKIPLCTIGNAGTVNTGAVDPLDELNTICKQYGLWLHLDAAYGGFAAATALRHTQFKGLELADSIAIDAHKWFFVPFECGCLLVKEARHLKDSFSFIPEYQVFDANDGRVDFSEYSLQQSRNFKALKVWMNFKAYGAANLRKAIQQSIGLMQYLAHLIQQADDFELVTTPSLSVVCFRFTGTGVHYSDAVLNALNKHIVQKTETVGNVFIRETTLFGIVVLRACCTNFRREKRHVEHLLYILRRIGNSLTHTLAIE